MTSSRYKLKTPYYSRMFSCFPNQTNSNEQIELSSLLVIKKSLILLETGKKNKKRTPLID